MKEIIANAITYLILHKGERDDFLHCFNIIQNNLSYYSCCCFTKLVPANFDARKEPLATCIKIYNYIMAPFKAIIPPIGMIDISPLIAFIVLQIAEQIIVRALMNFGL